MQYFVVDQTGQKYGPADVTTLNLWAQEGRIVATTMLEDASTGQIIPATQLPGLTIVQRVQSFQSYPRGPMNPGYDGGETEAKNAMTFAIIGIVFSVVMVVCCPLLTLVNVFSILGLVNCSNAKKKGNLNTRTAMICSIVGLAIGPAISIAMFGAVLVLGNK